MAQLLAETLAFGSAAVSFSDTSYGREAAAAFHDQFVTVLGRSVTVSIQHEIGKADYSAENAALAAAGGDVLVIFADFNLSGAGLIRAYLDADGFDNFVLGNAVELSSLAALGDPTKSVVGIRTLDLRDGPQNIEVIYGPDQVRDAPNFTLSVKLSEAGPQYFLIEGSDSGNRLTGTAGLDVMVGYAGNDTIAGGAGSDYLSGGLGADRLLGESGNDRISGGVGNDVAAGGIGADRLFGDEGNDRLLGQTGNDSLFGGIGNDTLIGGVGDDWLSGGAGTDVFVFQPGFGADLIVDFNISGQDLIQLDDALWTGVRTGADVIADFGTLSDGFAVLTFADGASLRIDGVSDLAGLAAFIDII